MTPESVTAPPCKPLEPFVVHYRRWLGVVHLVLAWSLAAVAFSQLTPPAVAVLLGLAVAGELYWSLRLLLRPPRIVVLDKDRVRFERREAALAEVGGMEVRDMLFGPRLTVFTGRRRPLRVFQPLLSVPLADVVTQLRARSDVVMTTVRAGRLAPFRRPLFLLVLLITVAALLAVVPVPGAYFSGPGRAASMRSRIETAPFHPGRQGDFLILTIANRPAVPLQLLRAARDTAGDVLWRWPWSSEEVLRYSGAAATRAFAERSATAAALDCLGHQVQVRGGQVVVEAGASGGRLGPGHELVAAGDRPVRFIEDLFAAAVAHRHGEGLVVKAAGVDGSARTATVGTRQFEGTTIPSGLAWRSRPVELGPLPAVVEVDLHNVAGPSAGLAAALAVVDAMGPSPVASGRRVAVTGTIAPNGLVGPIGGLQMKVAAAERAGAPVLVVPSSQLAWARRLAGPQLRVLGATTLDDAVRALGGGGCQSVPVPLNRSNQPSG